MSHLKRGLLLMALAGVLVVLLHPAPAFAAGRGRAVTPAPSTPITPTRANFKTSDLEYYLNDDGIAYIRPGLKVKVNSVTIGTDRKPVVDFNLTDDFGNPLDRTGATTPGTVSVSFIMAWYNPTTREYRAYTTRTQTTPANSPRPGVSAVQAGTDVGGTFTALEAGHYKYTFGTTLPSGFDVTKTHTLGIYATRNTKDIVGKYYAANVEYDFRPDGGTVTDTWAKINQNASCNNCHDPLQAHGETGRRDVKLCAMCHQSQTVDPDTGNTVDLKVMIHKIHMGENLPSVEAGTPYQIIGFGQSVVDFSTVAYPQDIRNCANCHEGTDAKNKPAQASVWYSNPSAAVCGSCHDNVNFTTGANHPAGPATDDSCAKCHIPDSGQEFDASVKGAHVVPLKSSQLQAYSASIISVTGAVPGGKPTVTFLVKDKAGNPVDATKLSSFSPKFGGPTTSVTTYYSESGVATGKTPGTFDPATGYTKYTFTNAIPATAKPTETWIATADIYNSVTLKRADGKTGETVRDAAFNPVSYFTLGSGTVMPRRTSVALAQCNTCHDRLALHGNQRLNTFECPVCHNPKEGDQSRRPATAGAPESVSFQRLVHRIHTGEELTQDFTVYGFGGSANNFNEVRFPGDRRNCLKCHVNTAAFVPPLNIPNGQGSVTTLRDFFSPQGPATAACLGCHDNQDAAAHAFLNTTTFPGATISTEACATCHGAGKDWAVDKVHAR